MPPSYKPIYVSGPMTGYPELNFPAFRDMRWKLRRMGYSVLCPAETNAKNLDWHYSALMKSDLTLLLGAGSVVVLPGWKNSRGATIEVVVARTIGLPIFDHNLRLVTDKLTIAAHKARVHLH